jgi:hypothetical protein
MTLTHTDYEKFEQSSVQNRRRLREEELILEVTETFCQVMEAEDISKTQIATSLEKSKGFVSQLLAGGRNLTLRSIADLADAVGCKAHFSLAPHTAIYTVCETTTAQVTQLTTNQVANLATNQTGNVTVPSPSVFLVPGYTADDGEALAA